MIQQTRRQTKIGCRVITVLNNLMPRLELTLPSSLVNITFKKSKQVEQLGESNLPK